MPSYEEIKKWLVDEAKTILDNSKTFEVVGQYRNTIDIKNVKLEEKVEEEDRTPWNLLGALEADPKFGKLEGSLPLDYEEVMALFECKMGYRGDVEDSSIKYYRPLYAYEPTGGLVVHLYGKERTIAHLHSIGMTPDRLRKIVSCIDKQSE